MFLVFSNEVKVSVGFYLLTVCGAEMRSLLLVFAIIGIAGDFIIIPLLVFMFNVPLNNLSVMSGRFPVFLG